MEINHHVLLSKYSLLTLLKSSQAERGCHQCLRDYLNLFLRRYHTRQQLRHLTVQQLSDIGLTGEQVAKESSRPFWK